MAFYDGFISKLSDTDAANSNISNIASSIDKFFKFVGLKKHLKSCGMCSFNGYSAFLIFSCVFILSFLRQNIYRQYVEVRNEMIQKDAIYGFLKTSKFNWELLVQKVALSLYMFMDSLTSETRDTVLCLDDSDSQKNSSKEIELTARQYDHVNDLYYLGYKFLALTWNDGCSTVPVDSRLMSSSNDKNRVPIKNEKSNLDKRSNGFKRRDESMKTKLEVGYRMVVSAIKKGFKATALTFDSWYAKSSFIIKCSKLIPVVCRVPMSEKSQYWFKGKKLWCQGIYRSLSKKATKNKPASALIMVEDSEGNKIKAKLVFIINRVSGGLITLLSTDTSFSCEKIIKLYSMRWSIENFFRDIKQFLDFRTGYQGTDYDGQTAYVSIVMIRYMFLSYEARKSVDGRTIGSLFHCCCNEVEEWQFEEALDIIFAHINDIIEESDDKETIIRKIRQYQNFIRTHGYKIFKESAFPKLFGIKTDNAIQYIC